MVYNMTNLENNSRLVIFHNIKMKCASNRISKNKFFCGSNMENAKWKDQILLAGDIADSFEKEREVRKASSRKELRCPDKCCENPIVRYCHGEIKGAYFAHLKNTKCDYAEFDKHDTSAMRLLRYKLARHFIERGFEVRLEEKLLAHHYSQVVFHLQNGKKLAVELGTKQTTADAIDNSTEEYEREGIAVRWLVVSDINQGRFENEFFYLKRYLLNTSQCHEFIVINTSGTEILQTRWDKSSNKYYSEVEKFELLELGEGELTIKGFQERCNAWVQDALQREAREREVREREAREREVREREAREREARERDTQLWRELFQQSRPARRELSLENYDARKAEIIDKIAQQKEPVYDSCGIRWIQCEQCGKIDEETEFSNYGGPNRVNLGVCNECIRKNWK